MSKEILKKIGTHLHQGAVVFLVIFLLLIPVVISDIYYLTLFTEIIIIALLTTSFNLMMGYTGMVSLGHAAYFGIGAYTTAILLKKGITSLFLVVIPSSIIVAGVVALILGFFCVRLIHAYFVFITLAFAQMVYTIIYYCCCLLRANRMEWCIISIEIYNSRQASRRNSFGK